MKTTYIWKDGKVIEKPAAAKAQAKPRGPVVIPDIAPFKSPIDGAVIDSRASLRAHERRHGVRQLGNDWGGGSDLPPPPWWDRRKMS